MQKFRKPFKEQEYESTIEASTTVPPELRALLIKMRERPMSKEEEVWGELLEERLNWYSKNRGNRDEIEAHYAHKEFIREFCRNRGIDMGEEVS